MKKSFICFLFISLNLNLFSQNYFELANKEYFKGNFKQAALYYTKVIEQNPLSFSAGYYNRGLSYFYAKEYRLAIDDFNKAIELAPKGMSDFINDAEKKKEEASSILKYNALNKVENKEKNKSKNLEIEKQENIFINTNIDEKVKFYVENHINEWQKKGEFEKTEDYTIRVTEDNRKRKIDEYINEALSVLKKEYINTIKTEDFSIEKYDADNETFLIKSFELNDFAIKVPLNEAPLFKDNFSKIEYYGFDFSVINNSFVLARLELSNPINSRKYIYDSKNPITYSYNSINYNFDDIEINLKQGEESKNKIEKSDINIGKSDVDINIPITTIKNPKAFAVIFGNEKYTKEILVPYAENDALIFKEYASKTLGIPDKNIHLILNASLGNMIDEVDWIKKIIMAYKGEATIYIYYAGHGVPNEQTKSAFLLPIDGSASNTKTAIELDELYATLNENPTKSITIFLDACFSGSSRDGMLTEARGVKIKPKSSIINGNIIVFSATTEDESAYSIKEKQHGLFTYYLLKKIQETKGDISYSDLFTYIQTNVSQQSLIINKKSQTPKINTSLELNNKWGNWKLK